MRKALRLIFALAVLVAAGACAKRDPLVVKTQAGLVRGFYEDGMLSFRSIPYMKAERFMPPEKPDKWDGIKDCLKYPPQAMQWVNGRALPDSVMSEQGACYLNVWTDGSKAKKPVIVWLHGGGFASGSGNASPFYTGKTFARKGTVCVTINHRLDILGYMDLSGVSDKYKYSANVGMMDVVAALQWIHDNIAAFGGDPNNVTVFGESGGGGKVGTLMCMPSAKGLFHKAIIQSGTIMNIMTREMSQALGKAVLDEFGLSPAEVDKLQEVPYVELYRAGQRAMAASIGIRTPGNPKMWGFGPSPDGEVLLQQPFQPTFSDISADVPLIIGTTFNELQRSFYSQKDMTLDDAKEILRATYGDKTDAYVEAFGKAYPGFTPQDLVSVDQMFRPRTVRTADARAAEPGAPTYVYMFAWRSPVRGGTAGAAHGYELPFVFGNPDMGLDIVGELTPSVVALAEAMCDSWVNFAKTGDPNVPVTPGQTGGLPHWDPYTGPGGAIMDFDNTCTIKYDYDRELMTIMQSVMD